MLKRGIGVTIALFVTTACSGAYSVDDVSSANGESASAVATAPSVTCGGLVSPDSPAGCSACGGANTCQSNGCYNGYWCATATNKCQPPPSGCSGGSSTTGGGSSSSGGGGGGSSDDGDPTRTACTGAFGTGLSSRFGRLDGYIVSVVAPGGSKTCNGDSGHVHLQVQTAKKIYDVAVNTDAYIAQASIGLPSGAWSEGWHTGISLSYPSLGIHSTAFTSSSSSAAAQKIEAFVASANHVSVFATGYNSSGVHLVHRSNGGSTDGAIVIDPTTSSPKAMLFRFSNQSF